MRRWGSCGKFPPLVYGLFILSGRRPPATSPGPSKKKRNGRSKNKPVNYRLEACQQIDGSTPGCLQKCTTSYFSKNFFAFFFSSLFGLIWAQWFSFSVRKQRKRGKKGAVFPVQGIDSESGGGPRPLAGGFAAVKRYVNGSLCRSCGLEMASANLGARPSAFDALERTRTGHWARLVGLLNHDVITSTPSTQHTQAAQKAYLGNLLTGCGSHIKLHSTSHFWIFENFFFSFTFLIYANIFIHWIVLSVVCFKLGAS